MAEVDDSPGAAERRVATDRRERTYYLYKSD
jgi:hypothetical protein